jgi:hypothetical protein
MAWLPFKYRDFYDIPRAIIVERAGNLYLFDYPFDHKRDEYPAEFTLYRLHPEAGSDLESSSWENLAEAGEVLGRVPVQAMEFDSSKRALLNDRVFDIVEK